MSSVAKLRRDERREVVHGLARVVACEAGVWRVESDGETWDARRAVGCLVEPAVGDLVAVVVHAHGCHVWCVLDRTAERATKLAVDGDLAIEARGGSIAVAAHADIDLVAARRAQIAAGEVCVTATQANVVVRRISLVGDYLRAEVRKAKVFARALGLTADHLFERVRRSMRVVDESDHLRARTIDYAAKELVNVRGGTTLVTAEELVKLDGSQVHLG